MKEPVQNPSFKGEPKRIRLVSNSICCGREPASDAEVEQRLTITADGSVFFAAYNYGNGNRYTKNRSRHGRMPAADAKRFVDRISRFFMASEADLTADDVGGWALAITNTDDMTFLFRGGLCCTNPELSAISAVLREALGMPDLYLFDGQCRKDRIEQVLIEYEMSDILKKPAHDENEQEETALSYRERILIRRKAGVVVQIQQYGNGYETVKQFHASAAVSELLNDIYSDDLFSQMPADPPETIPDPQRYRNYRLTAAFLYAKPLELTGAFEKNGLPSDFPEFAETVLQFIQHFCNAQEVLSPRVYGKAQRRNGDYIYLSVTFDENGKSYYYRTTDETLAPGDLCIVPAGKENREAIARVVNVEYFPENDVPLPLKKTKLIKGRYGSSKED